MKRLFLTLIIVWTINLFSYGQNTFPSNGFAGIGTSTPAYPLTLNSPAETGILTTSNGINIYLSHGGWGIGAGKLGIGNGTTPTLTVNSIFNGATSVGNVGIGTINPLFRLNVSQDLSMNADVDIAQFGISGSSDNAKRLVMGYDVNGAGFGFIKAGWYQHQWTNLSLQPNGGKVGIGTTTPDEMLTVNGKIHAKEVLINTSILPDYVFNKDYPLMSLTEVKNYIDKNHHLPEVPSAAEVEKDGLKLGDMNLILLKKVEELTLYLIELKKENEALKKKQTEMDGKLQSLARTNK